MPTYQYACKNCGHRFEIVQSFSDPSLTECPECGGSLRKVFNSVGVVFKGSGFYRNDSRSESKSSLASESKTAEPKSDTTSAKSDTTSTTSTPASSTSTD